MHISLIDQANKGLVNKSRCLECVAKSLPVHVVMGETMKFFVNERYQLVTGSFISVAPGNQQLGYVMRQVSHRGITRRLLDDG